MLKIHICKSWANCSFELTADLFIEAGEFVCVYGKSGSGKSSLLRLLSGLETPDSGEIIWNSNKWYDSKCNINRTPSDRNVGFVFQNYALFPNMSVLDNLLFANKDKSYAIELLNALEIEHFKDYKPNQLSGGQQQRVALARALAQKTKLLFLDEALSALDFETRLKIQALIRQIHNKYEMTTLMISHDISEVVSLADKVIVMENGKASISTIEGTFGLLPKAFVTKVENEYVFVKLEGQDYKLFRPGHTFKAGDPINLVIQ